MTAADVVTIGETMAAFRATGPLRLGGQAGLSIAGAESNVAIGLARLGHPVRWAGRVGADELGSLVLRTLRAEGVDVSSVVTDPGRPTGVIVFEPRFGHLVRALYYRSGSAGSALRAAEALAALDPPPRMLHVTGITPALSPSAAAAIPAVMRQARSAGTRVCLDLNYRSKLWPPECASEAFRSLAPLADTVIASAEEIALLLPGHANPACLRADLGVDELIVTRGAAGATLITSAGTISMPARLVPVVDVVGAGDAFAAGYLSGHLDGLDPRGRLGRAIAVSAYAVSTTGDWEGLPTRADLTNDTLSGDTTIR